MPQAQSSLFLVDSDAVCEGLALGRVGVWRWKINSDELAWTRNLEDVHHLPPGTFDGTLSSFQRDLYPEDAAVVWKKIQQSIETGQPYHALYRTNPMQDSFEPVWIETVGGVVSTDDGCRYLTGVCQDVTERVNNERKLERRLAQQKAVVRFGASALAQNDLQSVLDEAVATAADVLDVPLTKILQFSDTAEELNLRAGVGWQKGLVGSAAVGIDSDSQAGFTLLANEPVVVSDLTLERRFNGPALLRDHGVRSGISVTIPGTGSRPFGVFGVHAREVRTFDEADAEFLQSLAHIVAGAVRQSKASDHQMLLVREMAHRAGNMLQLVNSIAGQTFRNDADMSKASQSFSDRLSALARSNYIIARGGWAATPFKELLLETLKPFGARIISDGRNVLLPPEFCFDMGLVLHELATNSVKYGALGKADESVRVTWTLKAGADATSQFHLTWHDPTPARSTVKGSGFGSKLLSALIERKWNGEVMTSMDAGFRVEITAPLKDDTR